MTEPEVSLQSMYERFSGQYTKSEITQAHMDGYYNMELTYMEDLKQGQRVKFDNGVLNGVGTVVGKALSDQPIIGGTYIIEPDIPIRNEVYDYTHFVLPEIYLTLI